MPYIERVLYVYARIIERIHRNKTDSICQLYVQYTHHIRTCRITGGLLKDLEGAWNDEPFDASNAPRRRPHCTWCEYSLLLRPKGFLLEVARDWDRVQRIVLNLRARRGTT